MPDEVTYQKFLAMVRQNAEHDHEGHVLSGLLNDSVRAIPIERCKVPECRKVMDFLALEAQKNRCKTREFVEAARAFREAANKLLEAEWEQHGLEGLIEAYPYPFSESFDDVVLGINDWLCEGSLAKMEEVAE